MGGALLKNSPSIEQFVNDVKNLMLEIAARASAIAGFARIQSDTFKDATGINAGTSTGYLFRGAADFDVVIQPASVKESITGKVSLNIDIFDSTEAVQEHGIGYCWQAASSYSMAGFTVECQKAGTPTGTVRGRLYAASGSNLPIGGILAETADVLAAAFSTSDVEMTFTFVTPFSVVNGTKYVCIIEATTATTGNNTNKVTFWQNGGGSLGYVSKSLADAYANPGGANMLYYKNNQAAAASADIRQITLTLPAATTQVILFADVTLGTGSAAYYVSTDNGGSWTAVTVAQMGTIITVPSGTQLVARVVLTGNAELEHLSIASAT